MNSGGKTQRIPAIEAIRGFAAIGVALFHFGTQLHGPVPRFFNDVGWVGVDVFFVISGFVIPYSLVGKDYQLRDFPRFMLRRLARLEPPYLASIVLVILLGYLASMAPGYQGQAPDYSIKQIALHFLYLIPLSSEHWLNVVYWSLAYEFVFYLAVGLLFTTLITRDPFWTVALAVIVCGLTYLMAGKADFRAMEFLLGILTLRLVVDNGPSRGRWIWWGLTGIAIFWFGGALAASAAIGCAALIMLARNSGPICGAEALGAMSYSLYLIHVPVGGKFINLAKRFGEGWAFDLVLMAGALAVSVACAWTFARFVEIPAITLSRRIGLKTQRD